ncbi:uncharacterized protein [Physcomitrium patens]|uniref:uncharacterized protein n=1 Tax=Physcomitrium patens TaxID=3218 RepID=UPI003CCD6B77
MQISWTNSHIARSGRDASQAEIEVEKHEIFTSDLSIRAQSSGAAGAEVDTIKVLGGLCIHLEEKLRLLSTAKDFIPFVLPTRLVRSLSSLSNHESRGGYYE